MVANETQIAQLRENFSSAVHDQDFVRFNKCVTEAKNMNVIVADIISPLMKEAFGRTYSPKMLKIMVENGADVNAQDCDGYTALHSAASEGSLELVRYLLDSGASIKARSKSGYTVLHSAVSGSYDDIRTKTKMIKFLLGHGADINARSRDGRTPFHMVALNLSSSSTQIMVINTLLKSGAKINDPTTNKGETILHLVASRRMDLRYNDPGFEGVRRLVDRGADINAKNIYCRTPFHEAALNGNRGIVQLLINNNVTDVNAQDLNGKTPLDLALQGYSEVNKVDEEIDFIRIDKKKKLNEYKEIETLLRDHGAQTSLTSLSAENGNCTSTVIEVPFVNNTVTSSLPLLPSTTRGAISENSMDFLKSVNGWSLMVLAMLVLPLFVVGMVVGKMRARTDIQDVQPDVEMEEGLLDGKINYAAANLHEGIKKFAAYGNELPGSLLNETNVSQGAGLQR